MITEEKLQDVTTITSKDKRELKDSDLESIKDITRLQSLIISYCSEFRGAIIPSLKDLDIYKLDFSGCKELSRSTLLKLKQFKALKELHLSDIYNTADAALAFLKDLTELEYLNICTSFRRGRTGHFTFSSIWIPTLTGLPSLKFLDIRGWTISDELKQTLQLHFESRNGGLISD